jgi:uncharacterized protein (DUF4415 family)
MKKPKKTEQITRAVLTDDGKVMIVQPDGSLKHVRGKTNWKRLKAMKDSDIDYSDSPELDDKFWATARRLPLPQAKDRVTMRVDHDVLSWLKSQGDGYQTKINAILRQYMQSHSAPSKHS